MPPLVVPQGALLRCIFTQGGASAAVNVFGVLNSSNVVITQTLTNTIGAAIKSGITSQGYTLALHPSISLAQVGLRDIRTANQPEFLDAGAPVPGTATGDLLPLNVSLCVTIRTALAGRSFRGRCYVWGFTEANNDTNGRASSVASAAAIGYLTAVAQGLSASGLALAVVSRTLSQVHAATLTQVRDLVWDTQRKRATPGI